MSTTTKRLIWGYAIVIAAHVIMRLCFDGGVDAPARFDRIPPMGWFFAFTGSALTVLLLMMVKRRRQSELLQSSASTEK